MSAAMETLALNKAIADEAQREGVLDLDALEVADLRGCSLDKNGKPVGVREAVAHFRKTHPHCSQKSAHEMTAPRAADVVEESQQEKRRL